MLEDYLNQEANWEYVTDTNSYGEKVYSNKIINCGKEEGFKLVRDKTGTEVVSTAMCLVIEAIKVDDKLDSRTVIAVSSMTGLDSEIEGYEVYLI